MDKNTIKIVVQAENKVRQDVTTAKVKTLAVAVLNIDTQIKALEKQKAELRKQIAELAPDFVTGADITGDATDKDISGVTPETKPTA